MSEAAPWSLAFVATKFVCKGKNGWHARRKCVFLLVKNKGIIPLKQQCQTCLADHTTTPRTLHTSDSMSHASQISHQNSYSKYQSVTLALLRQKFQSQGHVTHKTIPLHQWPHNLLPTRTSCIHTSFDMAPPFCNIWYAFSTPLPMRQRVGYNIGRLVWSAHCRSNPEFPEELYI